MTNPTNQGGGHFCDECGEPMPDSYKPESSSTFDSKDEGRPCICSEKCYIMHINNEQLTEKMGAFPQSTNRGGELKKHSCPHCGASYMECPCPDNPLNKSNPKEIIKDLRSQLSEAKEREAALEAKVVIARDCFSQAFASGYMGGHNDTVEGQYGDPTELGLEYVDENLGEYDWLSGTRPALAVVEGLAKTNNIAGGSLFYGDQLAIWRDSECIHPDWEPVTVVVLERSSNAKQGAV